MKFIENGFEVPKSMCTALTSIRCTKKGAHHAARLWYWDPARTAFYVVGESMVLRCIGDIVEFAENESNAHPFDVETLRKSVLPHAAKGTFVRILIDEEGPVAHVVQEVTEETPEEILVTRRLGTEGLRGIPDTSVFDGSIPPDMSADQQQEPASWEEISPYLHFSHLDSIAKVSKVLKATAVRVQPPLDDDPRSPVRIDLALPVESGRWTAMLMPVKIS